ncbi:hypothetical protein BD309DRAFT_953572 [Dichomitus squalens]|nr:hypothetical protein BD309DRAFT_953572 [Dichomitus squalens]
MPKRLPTPEIDDGAKYLTVVNPYPFRPNMYLPKPRELFAQWIAACIGPSIGPRYLRAFYHKPTSPGCIIVEVDESLPSFRVLLGLHKWSEFLKNSKGHEETVSGVYYCTYGSDRDVQKNGWLRIDVEDGWFLKPTKAFVVPYPSTYYCDVPKPGRDVIQNDLCRPLPTQSFPPPPPPRPAPVVGTPEWQEWKQKQDSVKQIRAWTRNGGSEIVTPGPAAMQARSSGPTIPLSLSVPPGLARGSPSTSSSSGSTISDAAVLTPTDDFDGDEFPRVGMVSENVQSALEALTLNGGVDDEDEDVYYTVADSETLAGDALEAKYATILDKEVEVRSLWNDYVPPDDGLDEDDDEEDDEGIKKAAAKNPELCKVHHIVCKKGICRDYAIQLAQKRKRDRLEEIRKEREKAAAKREKKNARQNLSGTSTPMSASGTASGATSPSGARSPPPHLRAGAPRQLPPHLKPGASAAAMPRSTPVSPVVEHGRDGRVTPTPSRRQDDDDDSHSVAPSSVGWGTMSDTPWGPVVKQKGNDWGVTPVKAAPRRNPAPVSNVNAATSNTKAWGAWGKAPSISASSVRRNNGGWSIGSRTETGDGDDDWPTAGQVKSAAPARGPDSPCPTREFGAWGKAPSISASSVRRNHDSWSNSGRSISDNGETRSVAASEGAGWGANAGVNADANTDGPWGSTDAVKAARATRVAGSNVDGRKKTWAELVDDELDGLDGRSVAASTESGQTWGNVSAGPW